MEDFHKSMETTEKQRENFAKIRQKIIEPAVKELNQKNRWDIKWLSIKINKNVTKVRFEFTPPE